MSLPVQTSPLRIGRAVEVGAGSGEAWEAARSAGIGGSDVAAIVGAYEGEPWGDLYSVAVSKLHPQFVPRRQSLQLEAGHHMEPWILAKYAEVTGARVMTGLPLLAREDKPWMLASLDAVELDRSGRVVAILDAKFGDGSSWEILPQQRVQLQWYQRVLGPVPARTIAFDGVRLRPHAVQVDEEVGAELEEVVEDFWFTFIEPRRLPPPGPSGATAAILSRLHPGSRGRKIEYADASEEQEQLASELLALREEKKRVEQQIEALRHQLHATLGDAEGVRGAGWRAKRQSKRGDVDWELVAAVAGVPHELIERHRAPESHYLDVRKAR